MAHRYWRLRFPSGNALGSGRTTMTVAEIEFHTSIGGSQAATGGTAAASTIYSGYPASRAFDGNTGNFWSSNVNDTAGSWVSYDFGSTVDIVEFKMWPLSGYATDMPRYIVCEYSDDNTNWTGAFYANNLTWSNSGVAQSFSQTVPALTGGHRYWRVYATANGSGANDVLGGSSMSFYQSIGGLDLAPLARLTADSVDANASIASNLGQGASTSVAYFRTFGSGFPHWVKLDFGSGSAPSLAQLKWTAEVHTSGINEQSSPSAGSIQYSDDDSAWTTVGSIPTGNWTTAEVRTLYPPTASPKPTLVIFL
jgi:hypothetical protein